MTNVEMFATVKLRDANSDGGTNGCARLTMRIGNTTAATPPTTIDVHPAALAQLLCCPRIVPNARPPTATTTTREPSQANASEACSPRAPGPRRRQAPPRPRGGPASRGVRRHVHKRHVEEVRRAPQVRADEYPADKRAEDRGESLRAR